APAAPSVAPPSAPSVGPASALGGAVPPILSLGASLLLPVGPGGVTRGALPATRGALLPSTAAVAVDITVVIGIACFALAPPALGPTLARRPIGVRGLEPAPCPP